MRRPCIGYGRRAKATIETAREEIGEALCARAQDIVFTSGATEALHLALAGAARGRRPDLILSALEHDALAEGAAAIGRMRSRAGAASGVADFGALRALVRARRRQAAGRAELANNETGAIQPVKAAADLVHEAGGLLLVDAAQAFGKVKVACGRSWRGLSGRFQPQDRRPAGRGRACARLRRAVRAAAPRRRARTRPPARHGERARDRRLRRGGDCGGAATLAEEAAAPRGALRDRLRAKLRDARSRRRDLRRRRASGWQHVSCSRLPGLKAEDGSDRARSRWRLRQRRRGVLVGQGAREPCAGGDGRRAER